MNAWICFDAIADNFCAFATEEELNGFLQDQVLETLGAVDDLYEDARAIGLHWAHLENFDSAPSVFIPRKRGPLSQIDMAAIFAAKGRN